MSEFDNLYICPNCDYVDSMSDDNNLVCDKCKFEGCFVARHINEGVRKFWIQKEETLADWRFENRFLNMIKFHGIEDKNLNKMFIKSVKELFKLMMDNKINLQDLFPKYARDFEKTYGKRNRGWDNKKKKKHDAKRKKKVKTKSMWKQKRTSLRGILYEGAFNKLCDKHHLFENIKIPIRYYDKQLEDYEYYEPDFWFNYNGVQIPVEFKTFEKGKMLKNKFIKGLNQSRKYGHLSSLYGKNPNKYSAVILCSPEERLFSCAVVDDKIKQI